MCSSDLDDVLDTGRTGCPVAARVPDELERAPDGAGSAFLKYFEMAPNMCCFQASNGRAKIRKVWENFACPLSSRGIMRGKIFRWKTLRPFNASQGFAVVHPMAAIL